MQLSFNLRAMLAALALMVMPCLLHAQQAQIRAIHLAPNTFDVDVYIASDTASFYGLGYGNASAVSTLQPGTVRVRVNEHNVPTSLYDENITLEANRRRILLIFGSDDNIQVQALNLPTNAAPIPADSAYLRFVQASPDAGNVDIRITDAYGNVTNIPNVAYKANTTFRSIARGTGEIAVYEAGTSTMLLRTRHDFGSSSRGTVFITGMKSEEPGLGLQLLNEASLSAQQPIRILQAPAARLRVAHLVPDAPTVDIYNGDDLAISELAFGDASALVDVAGGTYSLGATVAGTPLTVPLISANLSLSEDSVYTATAIGEVATPPSVLVLSRPALLSVSADSVLVRVVHAAPGIGNVDVRLESAGEPINLTNTAFGAYSSYMRIPRGNVNVMVSSPGSQPFYTASGTLEGGSIVTLFATVADDNVRLNVLTDNLSSEQKPMMTLSEIAKGALRAVHLSPDAPAVDIFLNNDGTTPLSLSFRQAGQAVEQNAGSLNVKIAAQGTGIGASLLNRDIIIPSDTLLTAFAVGSVSMATADVITLGTAEADLPQQGQTSIRFLHASPDAGTVDIELTPSNGTPQRFNGIAFKGNTSYVIVPPGQATVRLYPSGSLTPSLTVQGNLPADSVITAIISGTMLQSNIGVNLLMDTRLGEQKPLILLSPVVSSVDSRNGLAAFAIAPNPARGNTQISYSLTRSSAVRLSLYNQTGELVAISEVGNRDAGSYTMSLSTALLPAGVYNAVLTGGDGATVGTEKLVVVK